MADFQPFNGVVYNPGRVGDISEVIAPPYDVISSKEQEGFYRKHENNVIRLILGKKHPEDNQNNNVYTRSAEYLKNWLESEVLLRDGQPGFYLTSVTFNIGEQRITRYGIIGVVGLEPFEKGIVLPHERTFSKVKSEQLELMKACQANFNPIFSLYSDASGILEKLKSETAGAKPSMDLIDDQGLRHKMWPLYHKQTIDFITQSMKAERIYIADGHHRYETALNYREWKKANDPVFNPQDPANFVLMNLISMEDPGLIILPAHRLLRDVPLETVETMLRKAKDFFEIHTFAFDGNRQAAMAEAAVLQADRADLNAIGVYVRSQKKIHVLTLKAGTMDRLFGDEVPAALLEVDVTVLTRLLMMDLLGFDQERLDDETKIRYCTTAQAAVDSVMEGQADMGFILNPTTIEQVKKVSEAGLIMPRKATYFYPKLISGQVMNLLR
jgi:uncharacterized protein (DUF1015 family)